MNVRMKSPQSVLVAGVGRIAGDQLIDLSPREAIPLIAAGKAVPDPELDELKERARKLGQNVDWEKDPKYKRRPRATVTASAYAPAEESFGEKLRRTVKERAARNPNSRTAHEEQVEREHKRYRRSARKPTKGE